MRKTFDWYLRPSEDETGKIWSDGLLTLDANVLLDLYRYTAETRDKIIKGIGYFGDRVWLPAQAAREFIRNRTAVITQADKAFQDAEKAVNELKTSYRAAQETLRGIRLIPRDCAEDLATAIEAAIESASATITSTKDGHPEYLRSDPVLDWVMSTFDGRIGAEPGPDDWEDIRRCGESRRLESIPPGYKDGDKEGDAKYGDYLLWRQILEHARTAQTPMILVTSERKEDWWETKSGKTIGPRPELLEEASRKAGQRILIYQTDSFLKFAIEKIGDQLDKSSVDEIREVDAERSRSRYDRSPAIRVSNIPSSAENANFDIAGTVRVEVMRAIENFTATVELDPDIDWTDAEISAELIAQPSESTWFKIVPRISESGKLNLHAHIKGQFLLGVYEIAYCVNRRPS
jgi:hypothetical protein